MKIIAIMRSFLKRSVCQKIVWIQLLSLISIRAKNFRNTFIFLLKPSYFSTLCTYFSVRNNAKVLVWLAFNENRANLLVFQKILYSFDALYFA